MAKKQSSEILRRKEKVKAAVDLRGVPEGTNGRVIVAEGLSWIRYWVAFDNGIEMGSIDRALLVRAKEWDKYLVDRDLAAERAETGGEVSSDADDAGGVDTGGGGGATVNGVVVPQLLIDRTTAALDRFGVSR